jgi:hypothetical protein
MTMASRWVVFFAACMLMDVAAAEGAAQFGPVPAGVILVKGAWSSAAGASSSLPEDGKIFNGTYDNSYLGLESAIGSNWTQRYQGPPPSDSGYYVLAQIEPANPSLDSSRVHILIAAQDLFFSMAPVRSAAELVSYYQQHLGADYRVERAARQVRIANRDFVRLDYVSALAGLHWHVLATEIRCHVVQFVFTGKYWRAWKREPILRSVNWPPSCDSAQPICSVCSRTKPGSAWANG